MQVQVAGDACVAVRRPVLACQGDAGSVQVENAGTGSGNDSGSGGNTVQDSSPHLGVEPTRVVVRRHLVVCTTLDSENQPLLTQPGQAWQRRDAGLRSQHLSDLGRVVIICEVGGDGVGRQRQGKNPCVVVALVAALMVQQPPVVDVYHSRWMWKDHYH